MAITFQGTAVSFPINGNDQLNENLFVLENGIASRVNVFVRRLAVQNDSIATLTSVMPLVKVSRITTIPSGGMFLSKCPFDTNQTSDSAVRVWASIASGTPLTVVEGNPIWEQYTARQHSTIEQRIADDKNLLPWQVAYSGSEFILRPGESLLAQVRGASTASNPASTNNWFISTMWEEDSLPVFSISGVVTLNTTPVSGAKVIILQASDLYLSQAILWDVKTTNAQGEWGSTIRSGMVGAAFVQYKDNGDFYTAPGSPFLEE